MKSFFQQHSYNIIKMFVNQFAISLFGIVLAMATLAADSNALTVICSVFAIAFYLFLIYTMVWEIGAKDRVSVDYGKKPYRPNTGLWLGIFSNLPNLFIALLYTIGYPFMTEYKWAGNMNFILNWISAIIEGMYRGLLSLIVLPNGTMIVHEWWSYFVIVIPAILAAWLGYLAGFKNFRMLAAYFNKKAEQEKKD